MNGLTVCIHPEKMPTGVYMAEILYAEASELLSKIILLDFDEYDIEIVRTKDRLLDEMYNSPPNVVFLGDSFSTELEEIIFSIKSLQLINQIPLVFIGEHYRSSILPVDLVVPRSENMSQENRMKISRLMYEHRKSEFFLNPDNHPKPQDLLKPGFTASSSRSLILDRLYDAYFESELGCLDVTAERMELVIENILERIALILNTEFSYISVGSSESEYEILKFHEEIDDEQKIELKKKCRSGVKAGCIGDPELEKLVTLFIDLDSEELGLSGYYVAGCIRREQVPVEGLEADNISNQIKKMIYLAREFERKQNETKTIYSAFSRFLPEEIINDLLIKDTEKDLMTGEKRTIVAMFSHIRHFDEIMADNPPDAVVNFLNQHFTNMVAIIKKYGGSVDKFIGDAIYAIFGAAVSYIDNADRAAQAAMEMIREYERIDLSGLKLPEGGFTIGVGLNEGPAIIGNIGCSDKFDFTAIGDTINLAARLESLTKHYRTPILVSENLKNSLHLDFTARLVDIARVKGKTEPTRIFSLEIKPENFSEEWFRFYENGIKMYLIGNWYTAKDYLENALKLLPDDFPTSQFLERCIEYIASPPEYWDGAATLDFK